MEVHFTPEQEAQLFRVANRAGTNAEVLVKDAALRFAEDREQFAAAVPEGVEQADRGEMVDDDHVRIWLEVRERLGCLSAGPAHRLRFSDDLVRGGGAQRTEPSSRSRARTEFPVPVQYCQ